MTKPPYLGNKRMREAFGDGYVDALRGAYPEVPESADFVMFWWHHAALEVAAGRTVRAGLITTNSITQSFNRAVVERVMEHGARIIWAVANHPWVEEEGGAAVRVAMTVVAQDFGKATLVQVNSLGRIIRELEVPQLNTDLSIHADIAGASRVQLRSNEGLSFRGFAPVGAGFLLTADEAVSLRSVDPTHREVIRPFLHGKDITTRLVGEYIIDFGLRSEEEARRYPVLYDIARARVKPLRDAQADKGRRVYWWRFGRSNRLLREATNELPRYIATSYVSRRRFFVFLPADVAPDDKVVSIASDSAYTLGLLSSVIHAVWAIAAGGRLGVGDDPVYNNPACFDPFPFPTPAHDLRARIGEVAERLDQHRKDALARDERVTMTGMYNVVEKLRSGEALTPKEREVHQIAACGVLRDLHNELDRLVAEAYGWPWPMEREEILERLVALHDERVEEERRGLVRWLRPEYQVPRFARGGDSAPTSDASPTDAATPDAPEARRPWPAGAVEQITALKAQVAAGTGTADEVAAAFEGAPPALVRQYLDALVMAGEARIDADTERFAPVAEPL